jgi:hypothetical protein
MSPDDTPDFSRKIVKILVPGDGPAIAAFQAIQGIGQRGPPLTFRATDKDHNPVKSAEVVVADPLKAFVTERTGNCLGSLVAAMPRGLLSAGIP